MASIAELFVSLGLDVDMGAFRAADAMVGRLKTGLRALAVASAAAAAGYLVKSTADAADSLGKAAQRAGVGADAFQRLAYAGDLADVSVESLENALNIMSRKGVKDVQGKVLELARIFSDPATDGATKAKLAFENFGKAGKALIPMLSDVDGLQRDLAAAPVFSAEQIKDAQDFNDEIKRLAYALKGLVRSVAINFLKPLTRIVSTFREWITVAGAFKKSLMSVSGELKTFAIVLVSVVGAAMLANVGGIVSTIGWYAALSVAALRSGAAMVAGWLKAAAPILLIAGLLASIVLIFEDIWVYLNGGDSLIGTRLEKWAEPFRKWKEAIDGTMQEIYASVERFWNKIQEKFIDPINSRIGKVIDWSFGVKAPSVGASATLPATSGGGNVSSSFRSNITINAAAGAKPEDIAGAVREANEEFWNSKMREAAPAVQ